MRPKRLRKKIRQLETRLQKDRRKLAKLEKKLKAVLAGEAKKRRNKASSRTIDRLSVKPLVSDTKQGEVEAQPAVAKGGRRKKERRKLNLSPERRAQLSAQMKARWAAKKAAATTATESSSPDNPNGQDFLIGQMPRPASE